MGLFEVILIGVALSADAMSVTLANMLANPAMRRARALSQPVAFGAFQGLMPLIGYFLGSLAAGYIEQFAGIVTFVILGAIGGKMVWDGFHEELEDGAEAARGVLSLATVLVQAVATSIDALAVGVSFAATGENIWMDAGIVSLSTFLLCLLVLGIGRRFGEKLGTRAQVVGGAVLIAIGVKALFV